MVLSMLALMMRPFFLRVRVPTWPTLPKRQKPMNSGVTMLGMTGSQQILIATTLFK